MIELNALPDKRLAVCKDREKAILIKHMLTYEDNTTLYEMQEDGSIVFRRGLAKELGLRLDCPVVGAPPLEKPDIDKMNAIFDKMASLDPKFERREYQVRSALKCVINRSGIMHGGTGAGKTEVISALCHYFEDQDILIINGQTNIIKQLNNRLVKRGIPSYHIGSSAVGGHEWTKKNIVTTTVGTLNSGIKSGDKEILELLSRVGKVFVDECHHLSTESWTMIFDHCLNADFIGFSGTPWEDEDDKLLNFEDAALLSMTGGDVVLVSTQFLRSIGVLAHPYVFVADYVDTARPPYSGQDWHKILETYISGHTGRNEVIVRLLTEFDRLGLVTLVLVQRLNHGELLVKELDKVGVNSIFVSGGDSLVAVNPNTHELQQTYGDVEIVQKLVDGGLNVVIGSLNYDEGVDIEGVQLEILAGGGKPKRRTRQRVGRAIRKKSTDPSKNYCVIIDLMDIFNPTTRRHLELRKAIYRKEHIGMLNTPEEMWSMVYALKAGEDK